MVLTQSQGLSSSSRCPAREQACSTPKAGRVDSQDSWSQWAKEYSRPRDIMLRYNRILPLFLCSCTGQAGSPVLTQCLWVNTHMGIAALFIYHYSTCAVWDLECSEKRSVGLQVVSPHQNCWPFWVPKYYLWWSLPSLRSLVVAQQFCMDSRRKEIHQTSASLPSTRPLPSATPYLALQWLPFTPLPNVCFSTSLSAVSQKSTCNPHGQSGG